MPLATRQEAGAAPGGFAAWRVAVWLLLLLAAFGCVQYLAHAQWLWGQRSGLSGTEGAALHRMLAWDLSYLAAALLLFVLCAGCILRQAWARVPLRVACGLLALWALVGAGLMLMNQWLPLERASADALAHLASDDPLRLAILHARRSYRMALGLKLMAVPLLLWLAWRLGVPAVRMQFRRRR